MAQRLGQVDRHPVCLVAHLSRACQVVSLLLHVAELDCEEAGALLGGGHLDEAQQPEQHDYQDDDH